MNQQQSSSILPEAHLSVPKVKDGVLKSEGVKGWNTKQLGLRLGTDAASAATASALVAPVICIIDQYVCMGLYLDSIEADVFSDASFAKQQREHHSRSPSLAQQKRRSFNRILSSCHVHSFSSSLSIARPILQRTQSTR